MQLNTSFSRWAKRGVWEQIFKHLAEDADNEYDMIDSTKKTAKIKQLVVVKVD